LIEYLYDAIRVSSGQNAIITAKIIDDNGHPITEGCHLMIHSNDDAILTIEGTYYDDMWLFELPGQFTKEFNGRYWYCVCKNDTDLCFKQPIYFLK
jgi:hypothetical protein